MDAFSAFWDDMATVAPRPTSSNVLPLLDPPRGHEDTSHFALFTNDCKYDDCEYDEGGQQGRHIHRRPWEGERILACPRYSRGQLS